MPASPQYSSVRRGSNMRRKLTLPVEPPVAMMTALRARMLSLLPLWSTAMPRTRPRRGVSRWIAVIRCSSRNLDAGLARGGLERPHQAVAGRTSSCVAGSAGVPVWTSGQSIDRALHGARHRVADRCAALLSGGLSTTLTPCASRNSKVAALLSAKARMISRSL